MTGIFKSVFILLALVFAFTSAQAGTLISLGAVTDWQKTNDGRYYQTEYAGSLRAGYSWVNYADIYGEFIYHQPHKDTNGNFSLKLSQQDYLVWARRLITNKWVVNPYIALGVGGTQERIERTLGAEKNDHTGELELLTSIAVGANYKLRKFTAAVEARISWSAAYEPNPQLGLGLHLGVDL